MGRIISTIVVKGLSPRFVIESGPLSWVVNLPHMLHWKYSKAWTNSCRNIH